MMKIALGLTVLVLLFLATAAGAAAQTGDTSLSGKVVRWGGDPVAGATVAALAGPLETDKEYTHTTTAADGSWSMQLPPGVAYWVHIRTYGTWWGYSYEPSFTLRPGEQISKIWFALGPRAVKEIVLPKPESNQGPQGSTPGGNVGGVIGMPTTGGPNEISTGLLLLAVAAGLLAAGIAGRRWAAHR